MQILLKYLLAVVLLTSCSTSSLFIVRHAEKGTTPTLQDPDLTDAGRQRAEDLATLLGNKKITAVYSTNFRRTIQTATPTADKFHLTLQYYATDTLGKFIRKAVKKTGNALIVSHSNRILPMFDSLGVPHSLTVIPENDYDNFFILRIKRRFLQAHPVYRLTETTYGAPSPR